MQDFGKQSVIFVPFCCKRVRDSEKLDGELSVKVGESKEYAGGEKFLFQCQFSLTKVNSETLDQP